MNWTVMCMDKGERVANRPGISSTFTWLRCTVWWRIGSSTG